MATASRVLKILGASLVGIAIVAFVGSAVFDSRADAARDSCSTRGGSFCGLDGFGDGIFATMLAIAGLAMLAASGILVLLSRSRARVESARPPPPARAAAAPTPEMEAIDREIAAIDEQLATLDGSAPPR